MSSTRPAARRAPVRLSVVAVVSATTLTACFEYAPPISHDPTPGTEVRLTLTDAGTLAAASAVGPHVGMIDGRLTRVDTDSVVVSATQTTQRSGVENLWAGELVAVPRSSVASLGVRRISPTRTALAAAIGVGVVVGTVLGFTLGRSTGGATIARVPAPK